MHYINTLELINYLIYIYIYNILEGDTKYNIYRVYIVLYS